MSKIKIQTAAPTTGRLRYVCDFLFNQVLNVEWVTVDAPLTKDVIRLSNENDASIELHTCGLLFERGIQVDRRNEMEQILKHMVSTDSFNITHNGFDVIFFCLSRYEEYLPGDLDVHGRYMAKSSALFKSEAIEIPVVDRLIHDLRNKLLTLLIETEVTTGGLLSTIDVDLPYYRKYLKFPYYLNKIKYPVDPYDTYNEINMAHQKIGVTPIYFILSDGNTRFEVIQRYKKTGVRQLISTIRASPSSIGVHPMYSSVTDTKAMQRSIEAFKNYTSEKPLKSRQHYLRLSLPGTYRLLLQNEIKADYSLGYAECCGFRAGTAQPFQWYDIQAEKTTELMLYPLIAMDVTLKNYMELNPNQASKKLEELKTTIKHYGGNFTLLWHNSSLSHIDGWKDYRDVYFNFLINYSPCANRKKTVSEN